MTPFIWIMALQIITAVLFTAFFSEALTLMCFNCTTIQPATCNVTANCSSSSQCSSMTKYNGTNTTDDKSCADSASCVNRSINVGFFRMSSQCCSSDFCNNATASDSGLTCYNCNGANGTNCTNTLKCKAGENRCITAEVESIGTVKGCASQNFCDNSTLLNSALPKQLKSSCCGANLCNNAQKMTQGPVLLLVPILSLLFYILDLF